MLKVNNDIVQVFLLLTLKTYLIPFSSVSIVDLEQTIFSWFVSTVLGFSVSASLS